jgi:hypothetical protein
VPTEPDRLSSSPFADGADDYWTAGWPVIPVTGKFPPEPGYTGWQGAVASYPDIQAWKDGPQGRRNIAIRAPQDILGVDVDAYGDKAGGDTLADREGRWGPLPATWISTSRSDGVSGIRLFRVPPGLAWPGQVGPGIETVHYAHRYIMCWPSVHPSGRTYRWIGPDGVTLARGVPPKDSIPPLPPTWVIGLMRGQAHPDDKVDVDSGAAAEWITTANAPSAAPCGPLAVERNKVLTELAGGGSRHDSARDGVLAMVRLADQGHVGIAVVLDQVRSTFLALVSQDRSGAAAEWQRIVLGAVSIVTANPSQRHRDPCQPPVPGVMQLLAPVLAATEGTAAQVIALDPDVSAGAPPVDLAPAGVPVPTRAVSWPFGDALDLMASIAADGPPVELRRSDGAALFYAGRINGIIGPSESGKTWIVLEAVRQALLAGRRVVYFDFEDTVRGIIDRLTAMGLDMKERRAQFRYSGGDDAPTADGLVGLAQELVEYAPHLIVLDGVNAAMTLMGLDLTDNKDATTFAQRILDPMAQTGAAVVYVDHVPKNGLIETKGGIGAQAKRAMTTGTALRVDVIDQFSRGHAGSLSVFVDKDRNGFVRERSGEGKNVGTAYIDPEDGGKRVAVRILYDPEWETQPSTDDRIKIDICGFLADQEGKGPVSQRAVETAVTGKREAIRETLRWLQQHAFVRDEAGGRGPSRLILLKPYLTSGLGITPGAPPVEGALGRTGRGSHSVKCAPGVHPVGIPRGRTSADLEVDHEKQLSFDHEIGEPDDDPAGE